MIPIYAPAPPPPTPPACQGYCSFMPVVMGVNNQVVGEPEFATTFCFHEFVYCELISGHEVTPITRRRVYEVTDEGIFNSLYTSMAVYIQGETHPYMLDNHGTIESITEFDDPGISGELIFILRMDGIIYFITLL